MHNSEIDRAHLRERAISRWDNEGGATSPDSQTYASSKKEQQEYPPLTNAELVHLRIRVIALENLVIALLTQASDRQVDIAREMAAFIAPRPGFTQHPLTVKAAEHMTDIMDRAARFGAPALSLVPYKITPIFDENTLPAGLRREHRTKVGVWGVIRVLEGRLRYCVLDPLSQLVLEPGVPGLVLPEQPHRVEPLGPMRMQVEFYNQMPVL
ncbi:MAG: DUF1971 domain-containing protein [Devosia sp.]